MFEQGQKKHAKITVVILIAVFVVVQVLGIFFFAKQTKAIVGAPDVVAALSAKWTSDSILESLLAAGMGALVNASSYFMRKLAYDSAKYIASSAAGQKPLVFQESAGDYFKNVALDSAAGAIDQFGEGLFGTSLCRPPDLRVQAFIQIGLRKLYDDPNTPGPAPRCTWKEFSESWEAGSANGFGLGSQFSGATSVSEVFANTVSVEQSDFGIALALEAQVGRHVSEKKVGKAADRAEGEGFKSLTGLISGKTKTPAQLIKEESETLTAKQQGQLTAGQVAGIYGSGMLQVIPSAISTFLNTLVGSLLDSLLSGGLFPDTPDDGSGAIADQVVNPFAAVLNVNREAAEKAFSYLITSVPTQLSEFDIVNTYVACPENGKNAGLNNCVMDDGLRKAIQRSSNGQPLTIVEALKEGLLDKNRELISPLREADNTNEAKCWTQAYCYSNIQKLRRVRILPLGFEIAALKSDPDKPWHLGDVVAGFEDCEFNKNGVAIPSPKKPFCHLIDPNWVIKAPLAQCEAQVVGPELVNTDSAQRRQECVDISTCLATDETGKCLPKAFGYCTKEENVWRIGGKSCPAQFATCSTYQNTKNNKSISYLSRTIDFGECNQESVGCRAYSVSRGTDFTSATSSLWTPSSEFSEDAAKNGSKASVYFNDNIVGDTCPADAVGCSAFYPELADGSKAEKPIYLKKAPAYYQCYDTDVVTAGTQWPTKDADFAELAKRPQQCKNFASACTQEEVGCRAYQPLDSTLPNLTGLIGANACPETCVGYDTFKQEESSFELEKFPVYFIPTQADRCNAQYEGCSEFTNIDTAAAGGENKEYYSSLRYCEKPTGTNERAFYSWKGSDNQGYLLEVHSLLKVSKESAEYVAQIAPNIEGTIAAFYGEGAPAYVEDTTEKLEENFAKCNETNYNIFLNNPHDPLAADEDCRALYDENGVIYYRLLKETVKVDSTCHPIRATESFLKEDVELSKLTFDGAKVGAQNLCEYKGGLYADDLNDAKGASLVCRRCVGGGIYENGACVYKTTSQSGEGESQTCPAPANLCRAYTGNAGNNVQEVIFKSFEPIGNAEDALSIATEGWSAGEISADATHVSQHSLQVESQILLYQFATNTIKDNGWYELTFWARGTPQSFGIDFMQDINGGKNYSWSKGSFTKDATGAGADVYVSLGQEWRQYSLGPVQFTGDENNTVVLRFVSVAQNKGKPYFIDNITLTRQDKVHFIRDSWKEKNPGGTDVPSDCDETPDDGLPGAMLGCRAYADSAANATVFATGFEKLCRPGAAGCQGMFDTNNTVGTSDESLTHIYNARCVGESGKTCQLTANGEMIAECEVGIGKTECYVDSKIVVSSVEEIEQTNWITNSTVIIPGDPEAPVYLTNRVEFGCTDRNLGCTSIALEEQTLPVQGQVSAYKFSETRLLNNPQKYDQTLCRADLLGCSEFKSGSNVSYFKDPDLTGNAKCEYKSQANVNGQTGWFMKDVGVCKIDTSQVPAGQNPQSSNFLCKTASDCSAYEECTGRGEQACYENYLKVGGEYGIWSNSSEEYKGFAGICLQEQNGCVELVDHADNNKSHYVIFDDTLAKKANQCEGKVSLKDGCALFDRIDNPNKLYNTSATYEKSLKDHNALVNPVTDANDDANLLLKVVRDRECSEWLACRTSVTIRNANNDPVDLCYEYKSCKARGPDGECSEWVDLEENAGKRLTEDVYVGRGTGWHDQDYDGYSLVNRYSVNNYIYVHFNSSIEDDQLKEYLAYEMPENTLLDAGLPTCAKSKDADICGDGGGRCYSGNCLYPIDGSFSAGVDEVKEIKEELDYGICKSYPEKDSPYIPAYVLQDAASPVEKTGAGGTRKEFETRKLPYQKANAMQSGVSSCEYQKIEYKDGVTTDYWPHNTLSTSIPKGICVGGDTQGNPCIVDGDCGESGGLCSKVKQSSTFFGQRGYCLEFDRSRSIGKVNLNGSFQDTFACLTWLPIQTSASSVDLYNADINAGYNPSVDAITTVSGKTQQGGEVYCSAATDSSLLHAKTDGVTNLSEVNTSFDESFASPNTYLTKGLNVASTPGKYVEFQGATYKYTFLKMMQSWAYKAIGANAFLLRLEFGINEDWANIFPSCAIAGHPLFSNVDLFASCSYLQTAGGGISHGVLSFGGFAPPTHNFPTWGTQVHGPRTWDKQNVFADFVVDLKEGKLFANPSSVAWDRASMAHMSPGPYMAHGNWNQLKSPDGNGVFRMPGYRTDYEADLNEYDLNTVFFVPTGFPPGGATGVNPGLLTKDYRIDFNFLREQEGSYAYLETAEAAKEIKQFNPASESNRALLWAYKLEEGKDAGLLSHYDYSEMISPDMLANLPQNKLDNFKNLSASERNKIHHRYVAVLADNPKSGTCQKMPQFLIDAGLGSCQSSPKLGTSADQNGIKPPTSAQDPFTAPCPDDVNKYNYIAIGMDFNKDGEFLGYISRFCHSEDWRGGINFATIATLNNICTEFTQVYDSSKVLVDTSNKAWTQRVWEKSTYEHEDYDKKLVRSQATPPFGSLKIVASDLSDSGKLRRYSFFDKNVDGVPYSCASKFGSVTNYLYGADGNDCFGLTQTKVKYDSVLVDQISNKNSDAEGRSAIQRLFVLSFERKVYSNTTDSGFEYNKSAKEDKSDIGALAFTMIKPPKIFAINPFACMPGTGRNCTAAEENSFSVARRNFTDTDYDGDGNPDEDKNKDGAIDPIVAKGFYTAIVNFFAYADDNQMPIRRVMVDWGDGSDPANVGKKGMYKNRKPFCESSSQQPKRCKTGNTFTELTCTDDAQCKTAFDDTYSCADSDPRFGDASRACTNGYFEFVHQYMCSKKELVNDNIRVKVEDLDDATQDKLVAQGLTSDDIVCSYVPKVQVLDNWGWCNGSCLDKGGKKTDGCYEGPPDNCDEEKQDENGTFPWTKYNGQIIVVPINKK